MNQKSCNDSHDIDWTWLKGIIVIFMSFQFFSVQQVSPLIDFIVYAAIFRVRNLVSCCCTAQRRPFGHSNQNYAKSHIIIYHNRWRIFHSFRSIQTNKQTIPVKILKNGHRMNSEFKCDTHRLGIECRYLYDKQKKTLFSSWLQLLTSHFVYDVIGNK